MREKPFFPVPEECLLEQAVLWVSAGIRPIPDNDFLAMGSPPAIIVTAHSMHEVLSALRSGRLQARGILWGSSDKEEDSTVNIHPIFWNFDFVTWPLYFDPNSINNEKQWPAGIELKRSRLDEDKSFFGCISVSTSELFLLFPSPSQGGASDINTHPSPTTSLRDEQLGITPDRRGRPRRYDYQSFYAAIIVRADLDGIPEKQAELARDMALWCQAYWGEAPGDTWMKEQLSPIYLAKLRGRKSFEVD
jgi:hypothetical protein